jgi:hypothetical protein
LQLQKQLSCRNSSLISYDLFTHIDLFCRCLAWRPDKFAEQCAIREGEALQLNFIIKDVSIQLGINGKHESINSKEISQQAFYE